jgi:riboflavin biosynthesis pyrimidine reductase
VFHSGEIPVLIVTNTQGEQRIRAQNLQPSVQLSAIQSAGSLSAQAILQEVNHIRQCEVILVEGGPQLMGDFFAG